jgi:hypothetical protein
VSFNRANPASGRTSAAGGAATSGSTAATSHSVVLPHRFGGRPADGDRPRVRHREGELPGGLVTSSQNLFYSHHAECDAHLRIGDQAVGYT